jgi:uncharacterized protein Usg
MGFLEKMTDFPIVFMTYAGDNTETCIKLVDVVIQIVTYLAVDTKSQIAAILVSKITASPNLKLTKTMAKLAFKLSNCMELHEHPHLLQSFCQQFYTIAFESDIYRQYIEEEVPYAEQTLSYALTFFASLLEHPAIWDQDVLSPNSEKESAEAWITA